METGTRIKTLRERVKEYIDNKDGPGYQSFVKDSLLNGALCNRIVVFSYTLSLAQFLPKHQENYVTALRKEVEDLEQLMEDMSFYRAREAFPSEVMYSIQPLLLINDMLPELKEAIEEHLQEVEAGQPSRESEKRVHKLVDRLSSDGVHQLTREEGFNPLYIGLRRFEAAGKNISAKEGQEILGAMSDFVGKLLGANRGLEYAVSYVSSLCHQAETLPSRLDEDFYAVSSLRDCGGTPWRGFLDERSTMVSGFVAAFGDFVKLVASHDYHPPLNTPEFETMKGYASKIDILRNVLTGVGGQRVKGSYLFGSFH